MLRLDGDVDETVADGAAPAVDLGFDETVTDTAMRCREIDNWLQFCRSEKLD